MQLKRHLAHVKLSPAPYYGIDLVVNCRVGLSKRSVVAGDVVNDRRS